MRREIEILQEKDSMVSFGIRESTLNINLNHWETNLDTKKFINLYVDGIDTLDDYNSRTFFNTDLTLDETRELAKFLNGLISYYDECVLDRE